MDEDELRRLFSQLSPVPTPPASKVGALNQLKWQLANLDWAIPQMLDQKKSAGKDPLLGGKSIEWWQGLHVGIQLGIFEIESQPPEPRID